MITAEEAADTIRLLIPGFVALKIFYVLGLKTRRSDLEWTLWSLAAAAVIDGFLTFLIAAIPALGTVPQLALGLFAGVVAGIALVAVWELVMTLRPSTRAQASRLAWDAVFAEPAWVQVATTDGKVISGKWRVAADSVEADELDLYLTDPAWVSGHDVIVMEGVEGLLIAREQIAYVQVLSPVSDKA